MADTAILKPDDILEALKDVYDPEIPINVVDLGLIYGTDVTTDGHVSVKMTLTFAGCGMGRDDTPPPDVNLDTSEIVIEIGEVYIPESDDSFLELEK